jgi:hypothetical protein
VTAVIPSLAATPRTAILPHVPVPTAPRIRTRIPSTRWSVVEVALVFAAVAVALGLAAVTADLAPFAAGTSHATPDPPSVTPAGAIASSVRPLMAGYDMDQARAMPKDPAGLATAAGPLAVGGTSPWASVVPPPTDGTPWDRLVASEQRDRRAFLLATSIQLHAPGIAATPRPRIVLPSKEG